MGLTLPNLDTALARFGGRAPSVALRSDGPLRAVARRGPPERNATAAPRRAAPLLRLALQIGNALGLALHVGVGLVQLLLCVGLALLLDALAAQLGVVGEVAGRLLDPPAVLVADTHVGLLLPSIVRLGKFSPPPRNDETRPEPGFA